MTGKTPELERRHGATDEGRAPEPGAEREERPPTPRWHRVLAVAALVGGALLAIVLAGPVIEADATRADATTTDARAEATTADAGWPTAEPTAAFPAPGSLVRDFALPLLLDEAPWTGPDTLRLSDHAGRWIYLDVFGSWCPPCRTKYPEMTEVARGMEAKGAVVLGLLLEDDPEDAARWLESNGGMAYPFVVLDEGTTRAWQLTGAPMGFLISPEGRIEKKCYGCSRGRDAVERLPELIG